MQLYVWGAGEGTNTGFCLQQNAGTKRGGFYKSLATGSGKPPLARSLAGLGKTTRRFAREDVHDDVMA